MPRAWPGPGAPVCLDLFLHPARIRHSRDAAVGCLAAARPATNEGLGLGGWPGWVCCLF